MQAAIARAHRQLPPDMPYPPTYQKVNPADQPILYIALTSPTLPLYELDEYGETMIAQRISMVSGVAQVQVFGAQKYAVRIQLDPRALATRGHRHRRGVAGGAERQRQPPDRHPLRPGQGVHDQASGQLTSAAAYRPMIVAYRNGKPVRLEELGNVIDSVENNKTAAWFVDQRAVVLAIQRQPGTNTVEVARVGHASSCPPSRASSPRRVTHATCCSTARSRSATRSTTSSSRCSSR